MDEPSGEDRRPRKRYRDLNREEQLEYRREQMRQLRASDPERTRELSRKYDARRRQKVAALARKRELARERAASPAEKERLKRFREENPDRVREYRARWRAKDPERAARIAREGAMRSRDKHADEVRERQRLLARENREARSAAHKEYYAANKERLAAYARDAARIRRRLAAAGLPAKRVHKSYAEVKRANTAAADAFFARERAPREVKDLRRREALQSAELQWAATMSHRLKTRERTEAARRAREFFDGPSRVREAIDLALSRGELRRRLSDEVRMDSRAREISGKPPYDLGAEVRRRAAGTVPDNVLDARLLVGQLRNPLWWKVHSGNELKDVFDWARAHSSRSAEHAALKATITQIVLERRRTVNSSAQERHAPEATGPAVDHSPTPPSPGLSR
ncbi:hypothetical protein ABY45_06485 [Microbacterium maritypicum]|uniref:hypothetical protein n=1 Tax=Microbacterium maritypicum TaxID=33918 RepID=UPI003D6E8928